MLKILFDFANAEAVRGWRAIDDRVMGGVSASTLRSDPAGHAVFEGVVSLARGGGFASVRSSPADLGLADARSVVIEARGGGKTFKLSLLTDDAVDSVNHQAPFAPAGEDWQTISIPLAEFRATFRGREVPSARPLDPTNIRQVGLLIAGRQPGPFSLEITRIGLD